MHCFQIIERNPAAKKLVNSYDFKGALLPMLVQKYCVPNGLSAALEQMPGQLDAVVKDPPIMTDMLILGSPMHVHNNMYIWSKDGNICAWEWCVS